jgi:hypothetical protein
VHILWDQLSSLRHAVQEYHSTQSHLTPPYCHSLNQQLPSNRHFVELFVSHLGNMFSGTGLQKPIVKREGGAVRKGAGAESASVCLSLLTCASHRITWLPSHGVGFCTKTLALTSKSLVELAPAYFSILSCIYFSCLEDEQQMKDVSSSKAVVLWHIFLILFVIQRSRRSR